VLYEMATGKRAFTGERATLIAGIMRCQPDLSSLSPPGFAHLVERCLEKDPENRWQNTRDVKLEVDYQARAIPVAPPQPGNRYFWPVLLGGILAAAIGIGAWTFSRQSPEPSVVPLTSHPGWEVGASFAPDDDRIAFSWNSPREDNWDIYV